MVGGGTSDTTPNGPWCVRLRPAGDHFPRRVEVDRAAVAHLQAVYRLLEMRHGLGWKRIRPDLPILGGDALPDDLAAPRGACDALQCDLALWRLAAAGDSPPWDWAGYLAG